MNYKTIATGLILITLSIYASGCVEKTGMEGTYICEADGGILDLIAGGQYELTSTNEMMYGEYTRRREEIRLKVAFLGVIVPLTIDGRDLIDPEGDRWVRD